ncbi:hypothetical protein C8R44DRAFT_756515 [Mycena epipterygia]|nr:hypothetical protein C8R44DRAFT_756515 [Mycena epipterygia]
MNVDYIDAIWGEFSSIPQITGGDAQLGLILPAVLGVFNLCFSIFGATAVVKSRTEGEYDALLLCVITTGSVNMLAAYLRRNIDDTWFGWTFTMTLMLDSILNLTTAYRIMRAYREDMFALPQYMPMSQIEESKDGWTVVQREEKSCKA